MSFIHRLNPFKGRHKPLIEVFVSRSAILHNLHTYQKTYPSLKVAPVLKSNAYGHGLVPVAKILEREHLPFFIVDSYFEAHTLRTARIRTPILIIGYTSVDDITRNALRAIAYTATSLAHVKRIARVAPRGTRIHLKIDTGMHRQGIMPEEITEALTILKENPHIMLEGICSHFADADGETDALTTAQIATWKWCVAECTKVFPHIPHVHMSASAGAPFTHDMPNTMLRLGLGLYGIHASMRARLPLKPALRMESVITSLRGLTRGERIGYNGTYTVSDSSVVATVPVGYFEGVDRRLGNCGALTIGDVPCPIVGRVSMNITSIDVSAVPNPQLETTVTIMSDADGAPNSVAEMAKTAGTIPWEILVHIPQHVRRTITT